MKRTGLKRTVAIIFAMTVSLVSFTACGDDKPKPKLPVGDKIEDIPNYVMQGFKLKSTDKGNIEWELNAKGAQVFEMKKKVYVQDFTMSVFEKNGASSILTGDRAEIDTTTNFLEATGHVKLKADNGMLLLTDKFFWDDAKKLAYGDSRVTVYKENTVLQGVGFESDMYMRNLKIHSRVKLQAKDIGDE